MAEFYVNLPTHIMASQIANLLNSYNRLVKTHSVESILYSNARYFVEIAGSPSLSTRVVGCVGLVRENETLSKIKHVCLEPRYRMKGVASRLIKTAIENSETDCVYMTIREDNIPSLKMAERLEFKFVRKDCLNDHNVITVARRK